MKNASPTKAKDDDDSIVVRKKTSLYQPAPQLQPDLLIDDPSAAATPAEGSDGEVGGEAKSDGEEQPADSHGVYLPKKPTPRNGDPPQNRFAVEPNFNFEDDEIGIREHHSKRNNKNELSYSGMDPTPNPKKFHFDQVARGLNSAKNKPEDLDEKLVSEFKVHPQYGLAVDGSINPDWSDKSSFKPTDWSQPLAESTSFVFIEDGQHNTYVPDHEKPAWHNSRSNWILKTNRAFEKDTTVDHIERVIEAVESREKNGIKPSRPSIASSLLKAGNQKLAELEYSKSAEPQRVRNVQHDMGKANKHRSVWPPQAGPKAPQRSLPYDPTKDTGNTNTGYQTPYRQMVQPRVHSGLDILANQALQELRTGPTQMHPPPRRAEQPPKIKVKEENEAVNDASPRPTRVIADPERNRYRSHQVNNPLFSPRQYSPQPAPSHYTRFPPQLRPTPAQGLMPTHFRAIQN